MDPASLVMVVLGVGLMLVGARLYRVAVVAPGLALGVLAAVYLPLQLELRLVAGVIVGGLAALGCHMVEQGAVRAFGALLCAGLTWVALPVMVPDPPVWAPAVGAAAGLLLFVRAFKALLIPLTSLGGALLVALAMGQEQQILLVGAGTAAGTLVQVLLRRRQDADR